MAPFRPSGGGRTRSGRAQNDDVLLEGLPVRQWRKRPMFFDQEAAADDEKKPPDADDEKWTLGWALPKDTHMYPEHSQKLLQAARAGRTIRREPQPAMDDDKDREELGEGGDRDLVGSSGSGAEGAGLEEANGFYIEKWVRLPREKEEDEIEYLAPRRPGLPPLYRPSGDASGHGDYAHVPGPVQGPMRKTKVRKTEHNGVASVWEVWVPEGHTVEGEVVEDISMEDVKAAPAEAAPGTVIEGVGVVNTEGVLVAAEIVTPRRKPPIPRKKHKRGPGRGRKKVAFTEEMQGHPVPEPLHIHGAAEAAHLNVPLVKVDDGGDTPMDDAHDGEDDEDDEGDEVEEGEIEEGNNNERRSFQNEDRDSEMKPSDSPIADSGPPIAVERGSTRDSLEPDRVSGVQTNPTSAELGPPAVGSVEEPRLPEPPMHGVTHGSLTLDAPPSALGQHDEQFIQTPTGKSPGSPERPPDPFETRDRTSLLNPASEDTPSPALPTESNAQMNIAAVMDTSGQVQVSTTMDMVVPVEAVIHAGMADRNETSVSMGSPIAALPDVLTKSAIAAVDEDLPRDSSGTTAIMVSEKPEDQLPSTRDVPSAAESSVVPTTDRPSFTEDSIANNLEPAVVDDSTAEQSSATAELPSSMAVELPGIVGATGLDVPDAIQNPEVHGTETSDTSALSAANDASDPAAAASLNSPPKPVDVLPDDEAHPDESSTLEQSRTPGKPPASAKPNGDEVAHVVADEPGPSDQHTEDEKDTTQDMSIQAVVEAKEPESAVATESSGKESPDLLGRLEAHLENQEQ